MKIYKGKPIVRQKLINSELDAFARRYLLPVCGLPPKFSPLFFLFVLSAESRGQGA